MVFLGTFSTSGLDVTADNGQLRIRTEGRTCKFVDQVEHVTFSGAYAVEKDQPVLYITERCVFALTPEGMALVEIAPGIDLERDILAHMAFEPVMTYPLRTMDPRIFLDAPMGLKADLLTVSLAKRLSYDTEENLFFVNFEGLAVKQRREIRMIQSAVEKILTPLDRKVDAIVNYDDFYILPDLVDEYTAMVKGLVERFYARVTRYTTSAFLRVKLGDAFKKSNVGPHLYESRDAARKALDRV